ncbi:hypothetical protein WKK05_06485 [Nostoc sp. UHCC 0302]|uniref:hypothetical protein n=1 Tax=Nostoc sp. UHCC 0302 TaxID=3134896 RepID=UPI00311CA2F1
MNYILSIVSKCLVLFKSEIATKDVKKTYINTIKLIILTTTALLSSSYLPNSVAVIAEDSQDKTQTFADHQSKQLSKSASQVAFLNGTWQGTYLCAQGLTNLKLVIAAKSTTDIDAVFLFSAHASNPTVPSGSFRMKGIYTIFNSPEIPNTLELKASSWISRPSGYITVDLQGNVSPSDKKMVGNVLNAPGCSKFDVVKVQDP